MKIVKGSPSERMLRSRPDKKVIHFSLARKFGWVCWYCGQKLRGEIHLDHIIPICAGGVDDESNMALTCSFCNYAKQDHPLDVFLEWLEAVRYSPAWSPIRDGNAKPGA
jgi:5-methylcytosine-specific restriction endonuclease McrA